MTQNDTLHIYNIMFPYSLNVSKVILKSVMDSVHLSVFISMMSHFYRHS